jgi:hypothetical protein
MATTVAQQEDLIGGQVEALLADGFTGYCCGDKRDPWALICVYEWPEHLDVITMHRTGQAAAARLANPGGVRLSATEPHPLALNPPPRAEWGWQGDLQGAVWALLDLPHPESPRAPVADTATPPALWVPAERQRPMSIRVPQPDRVGARAVRLSQQPPTILSEKWFSKLLGYVDTRSAIGFASQFTDDGTFTWGNFETRVGRSAITEFVQGFFSLVREIEHDEDPEGYHLWGEDMYATTRGTVTFTRNDGSTETIPFIAYAYFTPNGLKMRKYAVCLDPSPLVGVTVPV